MNESKPDDHEISTGDLGRGANPSATSAGPSPILRFEAAPLARKNRFSRLPPIFLLPGVRLPISQTVPVPATSESSSVEAAVGALRASGFRVTPFPQDAGTSARPPNGGAVGERNVRVGPTSSFGIQSVAALVGAGFVLGTLEAFIASSILYALPWVLGALFVAFVFWLRFGRSFVSEVIVVRWRPAPLPVPSGPSPVVPGSPALVWQAGRVRSLLHGGRRAAFRVIDCPAPLVQDLADAVRRFGLTPGGKA